MKTTFTPLLILTLVLAACTKESGTIDLSYTKALAQYGNIQDVRNQPLVASTRTISNAGKIFIDEDVLLIGEENKGIHVFDNSNPANPQMVLFLDIPFTKEFYVKDKHIYAESHYDLIKVDITDINAPFIEDRLEYAFADPIFDGQGRILMGFELQEVHETFELGSAAFDELQEQSVLYFNHSNQLIPFSAVPASFVGNGQTSGTINRVTHHNDHVYVIGSNRLHSFSDFGSLVKTNAMNIEAGAETVYPDENYLYVGTRTSVEVFRTIDPGRPTHVGDVQHEESCDPVLPFGNVAYSTLRTGDASLCPGNVNALLVLDVSDKTNPVLVKEMEMSSPFGMTIMNNMLYLGEGSSGMRVFDISNPFNPVEKSRDFNIQAYDVIAHPTVPHLILTTGPFGLEQYEQDAATLDLTLVSSIGF